MREKERGKKKEGWGEEREGGGRRKKEEGGERKRRERGRKKEGKWLAEAEGLAKSSPQGPSGARAKSARREADLARSESGKRGREKNEKCKNHPILRDS